MGKPQLIVNIPIASDLLFNSIPCSVLGFKIIMLLIFTAWLLVVLGILELFSPKNIWKNMCCLFAFLPLMGFFFQLEDDNFGYILLTLSQYFVIKGIIKKSRIDTIIGVTIVGLTGLLFWRGSILFLFNYSFITFFSLGLFLIVLTFFSFGFYNPTGSPLTLIYEEIKFIFFNLFPSFDSINSKVLENAIGVSSIMIMILFIFYPSIPNNLLIISGIFIIASLFSIKWSLYTLPFLLIGTVFDKFKILNILTIILMALVFLAYNAWLFTTFLPTNQDWEIINDAKQLSIEKGIKLNTDWTHGYWAIYQGINTPYYAGIPNHYDFNHSMVLSYFIPDLNCPIIKQNSNTIIYICP
jgi:hypothetical protein